jgi:hypothetical protein
MSIAEALTILHPGEWILEGEPTSEAEFHASFSVITGTDSNGSSILSSDVNNFQVNWATVSAKSTQIENDRPAKTVRAERDNRLVTEVDPIVSNALRWADLTAAKQAEWTQYRTDLLNVPDQAGFPTDITWPTKPS